MSLPAAALRLADLEAELETHGQMLPFEPPHFGSGATLGGCVAAGLSGPRRASAGAVRDFVLGVRMLDGKGDDLKIWRAGNEKCRRLRHIAADDRLDGNTGLIAGSFSQSAAHTGIAAYAAVSHGRAEAIRKMNDWAGKPLAISATCFTDGELTVRLSGAEPAVRAARQKLGGEEIAESEAFWVSVREQTHPFFQPGQAALAPVDQID